jgi:hypothetical protein
MKRTIWTVVIGVTLVVIVVGLYAQQQGNRVTGSGVSERYHLYITQNGGQAYRIDTETGVTVTLGLASGQAPTWQRVLEPK